ncbi:MAG TPA: hypothetical protein PK765_07355, partial [bacterium]|nr:hypothetical protein [bacterium]
GKRLIRYSVNRLFPNEHENPESEKSRGNLYDTARVMVRGSVGMLLDFAQADDPGVPARMREVIERMEADP